MNKIQKFWTHAFLAIFFAQTTFSERAMASSPEPDKVPNPSYDLKILETYPSQIRFTITPPPKHHINPKAPNKVLHGKKVVSLTKVTEQVIEGGFTDSKSQNDIKGIEAQVYVCDDQNTYCIKKTFLMRDPAGAAVEKDVDKTKGEEKGSGSRRGAPHMHHGFILNEPEYGFEQAVSKGKIVLIDFFGVWCPPCNLMDDTVFKSKAFKKVARDFVLIKLDADKELSWALKKRYAVGGYPTFIFATPEGEEISRVVGSLSEKKFIAKMNQALANRDRPISKVMGAENKTFEDRVRLAEYSLERKDYSKVIRELEGVETKEAKPIFWSAKAELAKAKGESEKKEVLMQTSQDPLAGAQRVYALSELSSLDAKTYAPKLLAFSEELIKEKPEDFEIGVEDLWAFKAQAYSDLDQKDEAKKAYAQAVKEYSKLISKSGLSQEEARGYTQGQAYCLWKSGDVKAAQALYSKMQRKYPKEFTFYFSNASLLKEGKDFPKAIAMGQKAFEFSYGDNRLRAAKLLGELHHASALEVIKGALKEAKAPTDDPANRTHRYIDQLKKLEAKLETPSAKN